MTIATDACKFSVWECAKRLYDADDNYSLLRSHPIIPKRGEVSRGGASVLFFGCFRSHPAKRLKVLVVFTSSAARLEE